MNELPSARSGWRGWSTTTILTAALSLTACGNSTPSQGTASGSSGAAAAAPCQDGDTRLPITGLCASRAANYLNVAGGKTPEAPDAHKGEDKCDWAVQETQFANDVLLYRALRCGAKTTKLAYAAGAGMAELSYDTAAWGDPENQMKGTVLVKVASVDAKNSSADVLATARAAIDSPAEKQKCSVRKGGYDFWPDDALVVDVSIEEAAKEDEPRGKVCGRYGYDGDASSFWRVFQGHAWYFDLGQDLWSIDPGSFTLVTKDSKGEWTQVD